MIDQTAEDVKTPPIGQLRCLAQHRLEYRGAGDAKERTSALQMTSGQTISPLSSPRRAARTATMLACSSATRSVRRRATSIASDAKSHACLYLPAPGQSIPRDELPTWPRIRAPSAFAARA